MHSCTQTSDCITYIYFEIFCVVKRNIFSHTCEEGKLGIKMLVVN